MISGQTLVRRALAGRQAQESRGHGQGQGRSLCTVQWDQAPWVSGAIWVGWAGLSQRVCGICWSPFSWSHGEKRRLSPFILTSCHFWAGGGIERHPTRECLCKKPPACPNTVYLENSLGRTLAPSRSLKNDWTFPLHLNGRLFWLDFCYFELVNLFCMHKLLSLLGA